MAGIKVIGLALLVGGILLFATSVLSRPSAGPFSVSGDPIVAGTLPLSDDGRVTLTGIAIHDRSVSPRVPYIEYRTSKGEVRTKQLVFRNERGCSPTAGDLPCVVNHGAPSPDVPYGEPIRVTGIIEGDQILVDRVELL